MITRLKARIRRMKTPAIFVAGAFVVGLIVGLLVAVRLGRTQVTT